MKAKGYPILINWGLFVVILLAIWPIILGNVSAFYHPNDVLAPYFLAAGKLWFLCVVVSFVAALLLTISRKSSSVKQLAINTSVVHGFLTVVSIATMISVEPVPDYFIQSVGDVDYRVPREFTSWQNTETGIDIDVCIETLAGIYSSNREGCDYDSVYLFEQSISEFRGPTIPLFFDTIEEFDLDGDRVIVQNGAEKYSLGSVNQLESYTVETLWNADNDLVHPWQSVPVHIQVDDEKELHRFVSCTKFQNSRSGLSSCKHFVKTDQGTLHYSLNEIPDFDLGRWQKTESNLLELMATWKVD